MDMQQAKCWFEHAQGAHLPRESWRWLPLQLLPCRHPWGAGSEVRRQASVHTSRDAMQAAAASLDPAPDPRPDEADETFFSSHSHRTVCSGAAARANVARPRFCLSSTYCYHPDLEEPLLDGGSCIFLHCARSFNLQSAACISDACAAASWALPSVCSCCIMTGNCARHAHRCMLSCRVAGCFHAA